MIEFHGDKDIRNDKKWYGVPPKGARPLPGKWRFVAEIFTVILIEFVLWGIYRYISAPYISPFGSFKFYIAHIIAAPTVHLIPIILYWKVYRKEKGIPFTFTRTRIMSGVMIGLLSAILWRVLEMLTYDTMAGIAGGSEFGTLGFFSVLDTTTVLLFAIMTFTHFCIVGPVEELQFRGFTQDQVARVLPNWQALVFASILFGLSHVPIAITVYKMPIAQLIVAEIGWMTAGAVFGALYMWSRNIYAVIIMHGMGNWQLSVFFFQSRATAEGMSTMTDVTVGTLTSLFVNAIMIGVFYLIFKYYWEPQRKQSRSLPRPFPTLQKRVFAHDYGKRPARATSLRLTAFCVTVCGLIMLATFAVGETDHSLLSAITSGTSGDTVNLGSYVIEEETITKSEYLSEGNFFTIPFTSEEQKYLTKLTVNLTWTDEPDIQRLRLYENQPDTFSVEVNGPNTTASDSGANPRDGQGEISAAISIPSGDIPGIISTEGHNYTVAVLITMVEADNYLPRAGAGAVGLLDEGNQCDFEITIAWFVPERAQ